MIFSIVAVGMECIGVILSFLFHFLAERERLDYLHTISTCHGVLHAVRCNNIFDDVIELYRCNLEVVKEFPLRVQFLGDHTIDTGGEA